MKKAKRTLLKGSTKRGFRTAAMPTGNTGKK
jgi:hypothetical protein